MNDLTDAQMRVTILQEQLEDAYAEWEFDPSSENNRTVTHIRNELKIASEILAELKRST